jgi:hypothetical protein
MRMLFLMVGLGTVQSRPIQTSSKFQVFGFFVAWVGVAWPKSLPWCSFLLWSAAKGHPVKNFVALCQILAAAALHTHSHTVTHATVTHAQLATCVCNATAPSEREETPFHVHHPTLEHHTRGLILHESRPETASRLWNDHQQ